MQRSLSLRSWFIVIVAVISVTMLVSHYLLSFKFSKEMSRELVDNAQDLITKNIITMMSLPLVTGNTEVIARNVEELVQWQEVYAVEVRSASGELLYRGEDKTLDIEKGVPLLKKTIAITDRPPPSSTLAFDALDYPSGDTIYLGDVTLYLTTASIAAQWERSLMLRSLVFLGIVCLIVFALYQLARYMDRYIQNFLKSIDKVKDGAFDTQHPIWVIDEFNHIARGLNNLSFNLGEVINHLKTARDEAETARMEAEQASQYKSGFVRLLSLELKEPINAVTNMFELITGNLNDSQVHPVLKQHLRICEGAARELRSMVDVLMDFAEIEKNDSAPLACRIDLIQFFDMISLMYSAGFEQKDIHFSVKQKPETGQQHHIICADEKKIQRLLIHLLDNALKYTREGSVSLEWCLHNREDGSMLECSVRDSGIGIPEDQLNSIFERFHRVDTKAVQTSGWGLGLAFVQKLLSVLGGSITVNSKPDIGSTFTVCLPVELTHTASDTYASLPDLPDHLDLSVLIVDRDESNNKVLAELLRHYHIHALTLTDALSALELAVTSQFDLVFVDYHMPVINGLEFANKIKQIPSNENAMIICTIAEMQPEAHAVIKASQADRLIAKPLSLKNIHMVLWDITQAASITKNALDHIKAQDE